jgi:hypothetical protein
MIKKLFILAVIAGLAYGVWWYMNEVAEKTAERSDVLKPSEKALREMDAEEQK